MKGQFLKRAFILFLSVALGIQMFPITAAAVDTEKQYRYHRYIDNKGNVSLCPYYGNWKYNTSSMKIQYTEWMSQPLGIDNGQYSYYVHVYQGKSCDNAGCVDSSCDTDRYVDGNGTYWFYQETRTVTVSSSKDDIAEPEESPEPSKPAEPAKPSAPPESGTQSPRPELKDTPPEAKSLGEEIGEELFEYFIDLTWAAVDTFAPTDLMAMGKAILAFKDGVSTLLDADFIGQIENKQVASDLNEILLQYLKVSELSNEAVEYASELINVALEEQPSLWKSVIRTTIKKSPGLILYIVSSSGNTKLLPLDLKLVLNIFEVSAERYWELGEAIAEYRSVIGDHSNDIIRYYEGFLESHYEALEMVGEAALRDVASGKNDLLDEVQNLANAHASSKEVFKSAINDALTFWLKVFHPKQASALLRILDELNTLEIDYEAYYWDIVNKS